MAKDFRKNKITKIIKEKQKSFTKEVAGFNKRLKKAVEKGKITPDTYETLIIDKPKKDFYKANIFTKKQFKEFISMLKRANAKTLKSARKRIGINDLQVSIYERDLYRKQFKNLRKFDDIYETNYEDIAVNVSRKTKEKLFKRLQTAKFVVENKNLRFRENFEIALDKVFNEDKQTTRIKNKFKKLTDKQLEKLLDTNPNFRIDMIYSEIQDEDARKDMLEESIDRILEARENNVYEKAVDTETGVVNKKMARKMKMYNELRNKINSGELTNKQLEKVYEQLTGKKYPKHK